MDGLELIKMRHSVRSFKSDPISQDIINEITEAGRLAPSAQNKQCWRFLVLTDKELIKKVAYHSVIGTVNYFIKDAPLLIIACADPSQSVVLNQQNYYLVDTAIAFQQMMLAAWNFGIGSCWLAALNEKSLKKLFNIPEPIRIVGMSPFGYPKDNPGLYEKMVKSFAGSKKRLSSDKIIYNNKWDDRPLDGLPEQIPEGESL